MPLVIGSLVRLLTQNRPLDLGPPECVAVVSPVSDWIVIHGDVATADNAGAAITIPATQIIDADASPLDCLGKGTTVALAVQYTATRTLSTDPVLNLFGLSALDSTFAETTLATRAAGIATPLLTAAASYDWTFADDATNDATTGLMKMTRVQFVDLQGLRYFVAGVKTAGVLSGAGTAKLLARVF